MEEEQHWFIAEIIMEITVAEDARNVVHHNYCLVKAVDAEAAYDKAELLGTKGETTYLNPAGKAVAIRFVGLADLDEILDPLQDGSEVLFHYAIGVSHQELLSLIPPKRELRALGSRVSSLGPDYASAEIVNLVRKREGHDRPPQAKRYENDDHRDLGDTAVN